MPVKTYSQSIILKVLYTFDDRTTFLVRSARPITSKIIEVPPSSPDLSSTTVGNPRPIGCIDLRKCVSLVSTTSPEWFQKDSDYSVYSKDVVEPGQPYVAYGMWTKLRDRKSPVIITGRLCKNVVSLYSGSGSVDTLEVRLRFCALKMAKIASNNKRKTSTPSESLGTVAKKRRKTVVNQLINSSLRSSGVGSNKAQLATRTQSLPFISEHSLAHRILVSDMKKQTKKNTEELDARGEPISRRFSNFQKLMKSDSQPVRAGRSKSFIKSVVKIGDVSTIAKPRRHHITIQKCINCASTTNPPYKFHRSGIYEFGNAGLLCHTCHDLEQSGDIEALRKRGSLGAKGLFDKAYSSKHRVKTQVQRQSKSSPMLCSSPMSIARSLSSRRGTPRISSDDLPGMSSSQNQLTDVDPVYHPVRKSLTSVAASKKQLLAAAVNGNSLKMTPSISDSSSPMAVASDSTETAEDEDDDTPLNATKLNTTLIQIDDDEKENLPPTFPKSQQSVAPIQATSGADISPSIQRIIDAFANPEQQSTSSPVKSPVTNNGDWVNSFFDFFQNDAQLNGTTGQLNIIGDTSEDPEISRVLCSKPVSPSRTEKLDDKTPTIKSDVASTDETNNPDTVKTQADNSNTPGSVFDQLLEAAKQPEDLESDPNRMQKPAQRSAIAMPSSPYFNMADDTSSMKDPDTSRTCKLSSVRGWGVSSSPTTEPISPSSGMK